VRIDEINGVIEVGHIHFSDLLKHTTMGTEAMFLMMQHIFEDLGYRRYEWKCDALNQPSRRAAERLGFRFEGIFRQAIVYKGRSRDTAWYSIVDKEWPKIKEAYLQWLAPENFVETG
jgi:RimJ/RimL family protein N-acetyltransferase